MGVSTSDRSPFRFGEYELDLPAGVLRKNGIRIRCQEQPLQVLAALLERPGELVTREDLRRRVWPQDTFVDFDQALNTAIKKIRVALNDEADAPRYIETVPRRGYRFVAAVEKGSEAISAPARPIRPNRRRFVAVAAIACLVLAILGFIWRLAPWKGAASTTPEFQRLTFNLPELGDARFTPDGASVVYSAGWHPHKATIYADRLGAPGPQQLAINDARLLAISPQAELAVMAEYSNSSARLSHQEGDGTLARVPLGGGAPRELLPQIEAADWSPGSQLAVVRRMRRTSRLEFPVGKVLYETSGWISSLRFSPNGDSIAFLDHPIAPDDRGSVAIIDMNGNKRTLSGFWESLRGLAWNPGGDEIWFAASRSGVARALYAVSLSGRERRVLSVPAGCQCRTFHATDACFSPGIVNGSVFYSWDPANRNFGNYPGRTGHSSRIFLPTESKSCSERKGRTPGPPIKWDFALPTGLPRSFSAPVPRSLSRQMESGRFPLCLRRTTRSYYCQRAPEIKRLWSAARSNVTNSQEPNGFQTPDRLCLSAPKRAMGHVATRRAWKAENPAHLLRMA